MDLTTVELVRMRLLSGGMITGAELQDDNASAVAQVIVEVSAAVEAYLDRDVQSGVSRTEYFDVERGQTMFPLRAFPVASVTGVWLDQDQAFGSETALTSTDYFNPVLDTRGILRMRSPIVWTMPGVEDRWSKSLKVTYTGGMAADVSEFVASFPDLASAVTTQVIYQFQRKRDLGNVSLSGDGGTVTLQVSQWSPDVETTLRRHRRWL